MNKITGKVVVKEWGAGIKDLVVTAYAVPAGTAPDAGDADFWKKLNGVRLGSMVTGADGDFALTLDDAAGAAASPASIGIARDAAGRAAAGAGSDLLLVVSSPDDDGTAAPTILHAVGTRGKGAGASESFVVRLSADKLTKSGLAAPTGTNAPDPQAALKSRLASVATAKLVTPALKTLAAERVAARKANTDLFNQNVRPALEGALSSTPADLKASDTFVSPTDSVRQKAVAVFSRNLREKVNVMTARAPIKGVITFTPEQWEKVKSFDNGSGVLTNVPAGTVLDAQGTTLGMLLTGRTADGSAPASLTRVDPLASLSQTPTEDQGAAAAHLGVPAPAPVPADGPAPVTGDNVTAAVPADIPKYIAKLVEDMTSPEGRVVFGAGGRATQRDVENAVDAFQMRPGPADVPAFYDFHQLQIAFEPVWQELLDQGLVNMAQDAHHLAVEMGANANVAIPADKFALNAYMGHINEFVMAQQDVPTADVMAAFEVSPQQWDVLPSDAKAQLKDLAAKIKAGINTVEIDGFMGTMVLTKAMSAEALDKLREAGASILRYADKLLEARGVDQYNSLHGLMNALEQRVKEPYAFTIYAANAQERSINFGLVTTYRQKWDPVSYQVGQLVKTVPLAPKESRTFKKTVSMKTSRAEKEVTNSLRARKAEMDQTQRAESAIMSKAATKTSFNMSTTGAYNMEMYSGSNTLGFDHSAEAASEGTKKDFHEAVMKASEEYKDERNLEVNTSTSTDMQGEESGEISNPNDEIPVTFMFYELQRRYRVFEKIHRATPVVLVAQEVPAPSDIDDDWLVANDWILKRVMLDDSLLPALAYLSTRMPGDEISLKETKKNIDQQRRLVEKLKVDIVAIQAYVGRRYQALEDAMERQARVAGHSGGGGGLIGDALGAVEGFLLGGGGGDPAAAARLREQAAQDAFDKAAKEEQQARGKLEREVTALNDLSASYTKALAEHLNRKAQVLRLRVHVKANILYYMQAIWAHEPPDQRYFRLHKVKVPKFAPAAPATYTMERRTDWSGGVPDPETAAHTFEFTPNAPIAPDFNGDDKFTTLDQVADIDGLLGYKGNYMIFPLKASNPLTDLMIAPYVDAAVNLHDPDEAGNWTLDEFSSYVCRLQETLTPEQFNARKDVLKAQYKTLLMRPLRNGEEIIVPTGSLFIEALPGAHPILEDFKLMHRAIDVKKAQAELRRAELENVRLAARLLGHELEDPDIEKKILIQGNANVVVPASDN